MVGTNLGKCEWVWEEKLRWLNPIWLPSSSWVRMNEFESDWITLSQSQSGVRVFLSESERRKQGVWIQHVRIQDDCHHQVESEWMSEVFLIQHCRIQDGSHHQFQSVWISEGFFVQMVGTNLGKCEWVWEEKLRWLNPRWPNSRRQNSRWLPSSSCVRLNEWSSFLCIWWGGKCEWSLFYANGGNQSWQVWLSLRGKTNVAESKMAKFKKAKFKMAAIIKLSQNEWVWVRLN